MKKSTPIAAGIYLMKFSTDVLLIAPRTASP